MSSGARYDAAVAAGAAAPSSLMGLHIGFKKRLEAIAARFPLLETKEPGVVRAPAVYDGWLPFKDGAEDRQFPFLILRPSNGQDTEEGADQNADAILKVVIGTYSDTNDGWLDVLQLIDAIRYDLGEEPAIEGTAYEHWGPLVWQIPEQQPRPEWFGSVTTKWNIARPRRIEARNAPEEG